jgi:hypothetical protein
MTTAAAIGPRPGERVDGGRSADVTCGTPAPPGGGRRPDCAVALGKTRDPSAGGARAAVRRRGRTEGAAAAQPAATESGHGRGIAFRESRSRWPRLMTPARPTCPGREGATWANAKQARQPGGHRPERAVIGNRIPPGPGGTPRLRVSGGRGRAALGPGPRLSGSGGCCSRRCWRRAAVRGQPSRRHRAWPAGARKPMAMLSRSPSTRRSTIPPTQCRNHRRAPHANRW